MGFTDWLRYQVKTVGVGLVSVLLMLFGLAMFIGNQPVVAAIVIALGGGGLLWVRYQAREHHIKTEQRKYGRR